ncbi:MAG: pilus assembly protein [Woeseiaceae bacterium]|nr:pilus assembly protein [Woeseiaceae bacterium]
MTYTMAPRARQSGAALVVALVFLLVMTLLSTSTMRSATMQERMAGNSRDYNLGFQAAEAALREAENYLRVNIDTLPDFDDTNAHYVVNSANRPVWHEYPTSDGSGYVTGSSVLGTARAPRYYLEQLTTARPPGTETEAGTAVDEIFYFRITAVGYGQSVDNGGNPLTAVVLSSVFRSR